LLPSRVKKNYIATETVRNRRVNKVDLQRHETEERTAGKTSGNPRMKNFSESRKEAETRKTRMISAKTTSRIGTWNVRTLNKPGSLEQVMHEMSAYGMGLLGISEMRWKGQGMKISDGMTIYYSGSDKHVGGVGFITNAQMAQAVLSWDPVSDRIITLRLQTRIVKVTIVQVYAPINAADDEEKDAFYDQLQQVLDSIPAHDLKLVMGDFNAQIGADNRG
jgi:hypothetical protein